MTPKESATRNDLKRVREEIARTGEPSYTFQIGDSITCGNLKNCVVDEILEDGKIIGFTYTDTRGDRFSSTQEEYTSYRYIPWFQARPITHGNTSFTKNKDLRITFLQQPIMSLISKHYSFGINYDAKYQRGNVWEDEDKEALLDSIFLGADIGKFVFAHYDDSDWEKTGCSYEVVDGKQRLTTLIEYYENRFPYNGVYYNDLSYDDKLTFKNTMVAVGEISDYTEETILRIFLMVNRGGKAVDDAVIENAKTMLANITKEKN